MKKKQVIQILSLGLLIFSSVGSAANALPWTFKNPRYRSSTPIKSKSTNKFFAANFTPPNNSSLRYTIGGAVRNEDLCAADSLDSGAITALVSSESEALTSKSHPEMFALVPTLSSDKQANLIVKNESESYYQMSSLVIPAEGGKVAMSLPDNVPGLEVGESYSWFLQIQCGVTAQVEDPIVSGVISRVSVDLPEMTQEESAEYFAVKGIWYDSLAAANYLAIKGDSRYWDFLLTSVNLEM